MFIIALLCILHTLYAYSETTSDKTIEIETTQAETITYLTNNMIVSVNLHPIGILIPSTSIIETVTETIKSTITINHSSGTNIKYGNKNLFLVLIKKTFEDAKTHCEMYGGSLANINEYNIQSANNLVSSYVRLGENSLWIRSDSKHLMNTVFFAGDNDKIVQLFYEASPEKRLFFLCEH
eukprot:GHVP01002921.1.p1 GENE.GHVP01002921.1~~GHVP01002921.1.p1  ORF type:complete len:180 (-),score=14.33 GHVP01002921.1:594-1133(-)